MSDEISVKQVSGTGDYQVCFKSSATVILTNVELFAIFSGNEPMEYLFKRGDEKVSFTAHYSSGTGRGEKPLDDVIDAIFRLK